MVNNGLTKNSLKISWNGKKKEPQQLKKKKKCGWKSIILIDEKGEWIKYYNVKGARYSNI